MRITGFFFFILIISVLSCTETATPSEKLEDVKVEDTTSKDSIVIKLNRDQIRQYNSSTSQVASALQKILYGGDSLTIDELLEKRITFINNKGESIFVPIQKVIDTVYYQ